MEKFPLEKILTISAEEYCKMKCTNLSDYEPEGVHGESVPLRSLDVPEGTEVVVNYRASVSTSSTGYMSDLSGTALIPKKK